MTGRQGPALPLWISWRARERHPISGPNQAADCTDRRCQRVCRQRRFRRHGGYHEAQRRHDRPNDGHKLRPLLSLTPRTTAAHASDIRSSDLCGSDVIQLVNFGKCEVAEFSKKITNSIRDLIDPHCVYDPSCRYGNSEFRLQILIEPAQRFFAWYDL
jgi:hypothetical protein